MLVALVPYYLHGGTTAELVAALPGALLEGMVGLTAMLGLPLTILAGLALWVRKRMRE